MSCFFPNVIIPAHHTALANHTLHPPLPTVCTAIGGTPIRDWVLWDSGLTPEAYAKRMGTGSHWGGAIEMAVCARLQGVRVCVFESTRGGRYQQIAAFETGPAQRDVHVVYSGRCHYDALLVSK